MSSQKEYRALATWASWKFPTCLASESLLLSHRVTGYPKCLLISPSPQSKILKSKEKSIFFFISKGDEKSAPVSVFRTYQILLANVLPVKLDVPTTQPSNLNGSRCRNRFLGIQRKGHFCIELAYHLHWASLNHKN